MSAETFHNVLRARGATRNETLLAEQLRAASALGHPLVEIGTHAPAWRVWECPCCEAKVFWRVGTEETSGSAAKRSCADQIRHWQSQGLASESMLTWLADREASQ